MIIDIHTVIDICTELLLLPLLLGTEHTLPEPETAAAWAADCKLAGNTVDNTETKINISLAHLTYYEGLNE